MMKADDGGRLSAEDKFDADTAQRLLLAWKALHAGEMKVAPQFDALAQEFMAAPLTVLGLVDTSALSQEAVSFGRMAGMGVRHFKAEKEAPPPKPIVATDAQVELFRLFSQLFAGLTGRAAEQVAKEADIRELMLHRLKHETGAMARSTNEAAQELVDFYNKHTLALFQHAKTFGGMRLVTGGQRMFGPSALAGVRITGLYADTQLIPDPIYPFLASDLSLNAKELQLAIALFHILQLRPLVDARLPVPPVFVFPSFEQSLEEEDAHTKLGIEQLVLGLVGPLCEGNISSLGELFEYARKREDAFVQAVLSARLFVPPGGDPTRTLQPAEAIQSYLTEIEGIRSEAVVKTLRALPPGILIVNGVLERLRPYFHLIENASELGAQPLLSQAVHWHYFEKCADAAAQSLRRNDILSEQAFQTLQALQDDSLSWLANISVEGLTELIANNEHRWLREELNKYTSQLAGSQTGNTNEMVREVNHGLASLVQRQQKAMNEIERKYAPKKLGTYLGGGAGLLMAGVAYMLPSLSPMLGMAVPAAAALGALGGGAIGFGKEKLGEQVEKRQAERSMLGVLALTRPR